MAYRVIHEFNENKQRDTSSDEEKVPAQERTSNSMLEMVKNNTDLLYN
jgi:hypothetical protein